MTNKLNEFYLKLATNSVFLARFNMGSSDAEIRLNRLKLAAESGVELDEAMLNLDQKALGKILAKELSLRNDGWQNYQQLINSATNTDNKLTDIGLH